MREVRKAAKMAGKKAVVWGILLGLVLAVLVIGVVAIMYFSQFFAPLLKKTGFLTEEFKEPVQPITDFPIEQYRDLLQQTLGHDFSIMIQFELDVDVAGSWTNRDYPYFKEYTSLRAADMGKKEVTLPQITTAEGTEDVNEIEGVKALVILFNKRGLQQAALVRFEDPEVETKHAIQIPETTPEGEFKKDVNGVILSQNVGTIQINKIEGQTLTYTITPFVEAGYLVS